MGLNATQYAGQHGIKNLRKIKTWFDAGYLGEATKDEKTGVYDIPEDTPLPYNANSQVSTIPTLWRDILIAASLQQSIYEKMYPLFQAGTVESEIEKFSDEGLIEVRVTSSGAKYLHLCASGYEKLAKLNKSQQKNVLLKIASFVADGATLMKAFSEAWPYIEVLLEKYVFK